MLENAEKKNSSCDTLCHFFLMVLLDHYVICRFVFVPWSSEADDFKNILCFFFFQVVHPRCVSNNIVCVLSLHNLCILYYLLVDLFVLFNNNNYMFRPFNP